MIGPAPGPVVHVVGWARRADRVTGSARALSRRLTGDREARLVAVRREPGCDDIGDVSALTDRDAVVVHTVDGGADLADLVPRLATRSDAAAEVLVVHHGSAPGSDRGVLRRLRGLASGALAADPGARDELHALGFRNVGHLDPSLLDGALADVIPAQASLDNLAQHPGPRVLRVGPCTPDQSVERLLDAFAALVTHHRPSATLSVCGPAPEWYHARLRRRIRGAGLVACELLSPATDEQVVARLERATVVVELHPVGLDPFLRTAARRGVPVVAPLVAATAWLPEDQLVPVAPDAPPREIATALAAATERAGATAAPARR
jgi:hypothetical protein